MTCKNKYNRTTGLPTMKVINCAYKKTKKILPYSYFRNSIQMTLEI
jgi:hypothetical protein